MTDSRNTKQSAWERAEAIKKAEEERRKRLDKPKK